MDPEIRDGIASLIAQAKANAANPGVVPRAARSGSGFLHLQQNTPPARSPAGAMLVQTAGLWRRPTTPIFNPKTSELGAIAADIAAAMLRVQRSMRWLPVR